MAQAKGHVGEPSISGEGQAVTITLEVDDRVAIFTIENPIHTMTALNVSLRCVVMTAGQPSTPFPYSLNLHSASARKELASQLHLVEPVANERGAATWTVAVTKVYSAFVSFYEELRRRETKSADVIESQPVFMDIDPFLERGAANILFGHGGGGKTFLALRMGMALASGADFLGENAGRRTGVLFVDYENNEGTFRDRIDKLQPFVPGFTDEHKAKMFYKPSHGTPFPELKNDVLHDIEDKGIGLVIIDSAALACGEEPEKSTGAIRYFNTVNDLGITSLTIAHQSKGSDGSYAFGSIFWTNSARNIWSAEGKRDEKDDNVINVILKHRKANNGKLHHPRAARIWFGGKGIDISSTSTAKLIEGQPGEDAILNILREGAKKGSEIIKETGLSSTYTYRVLKHLENRGVIEKIGKLYMMKVSEPVPIEAYFSDEM